MRPWGRKTRALGAAWPDCRALELASASDRAEDVVDHESRPEQALEDGERMPPKRICLLPEPHPGAEDPEGVDRASASSCAPVVAAHRHPPFRVGGSVVIAEEPSHTGPMPAQGGELGPRRSGTKRGPEGTPLLRIFDLARPEPGTG